VTYGAGGSTRDLTHDLVERIQHTTKLDPIPHLTCVCHNEKEIEAFLLRYAKSSIGNILALGGDRPVEIAYDKSRDSFQHAIDLVKFIRRFNESGAHPDRRGFGIGVAGFPEGHPATPNRLTEMDYFKAKVDAGADYIKMYGSTGSFADVTGRQTFSYEEMKAAVDAAHRLGMKIAIHSYGPEGGRDTMRAGAETVEHPVDLVESTLAEFAKRGTVYVPTIDHNRYYAEYRQELGYTAEQAAALDAFRARNFETARRAFKAGVIIAMGSDAVYTMFGQNTRELGWFVQLGMTPAQALATATTNGAALLGMSDRLGAIAPGYYADIVAVEGNPLADINVVLQKVRWVMKGGAVVVDKR